MTVHLHLGRNVASSSTHPGPQIPDGKFGLEEMVATGAVSTIACPNPQGGHAIATVTNTYDDPVYVDFDAAPDAAVVDEDRHIVLAGSVRVFAIATGDKMSVAAV